MRDRLPRLGFDPGVSKELLRLAWPLILTNGFWTLQICLNRVFLNWYSSDAAGAVMAGALLFWVPLSLLQGTAGYATTFVAQYLGAGQPRRIGAAVWQSLWFSVLTGLAFVAVTPFVGSIIALGGHSQTLQELETAFCRITCFTALPSLVTASVCSFFTGRGNNRTVLLIMGAGLAVNGVLDYLWIFGKFGFPAWGIVGAGWATVAGTSVSALLALYLLFRPCFREEHATVAAWRFEPGLFGRLMRFGLPSGLYVALDCLGFTLFTWLVGRLGEVELAATTIAWTLNLIVYMPMIGLAQGVSVLVGRRLGEDRPDRAEVATWTGLWLALGFTITVGAIYLIWPGTLTELFRGEGDPDQWTRIAVLVPLLLRFVVVYCLFDAMNLVFSFALRGAGDTKFVSAVALLLSWPVMVIPTWAAWRYGWGLYAAWAFLSLYVVLLSLVFLLRFLQGRWRMMRVIETPTPVEQGAWSVQPEALALGATGQNSPLPAGERGRG